MEKVNANHLVGSLIGKAMGQLPKAADTDAKGAAIEEHRDAKTIAKELIGAVSNEADKKTATMKVGSRKFQLFGETRSKIVTQIDPNERAGGIVKASSSITDGLNGKCSSGPK